MYLVKRRRRWWALHDIPADVRKAIGHGVRFAQSLDTEDHKTATRRAAVLEARWRLEIERGRNSTTDPLEADARFWRDALSVAEEHEKPLILDSIATEARDRVDRAGAAAGIVDHRDPRYSELPEHTTSERFYALATGKLVRVDEHMDAWLATIANLNGAKSNDMKKTAVRKFAKLFPYLQDVTRRDVQRWINKMVTEDGKKASTPRKALSDLRQYWSYLQAEGVVAEDHSPFDKVTIPREARTGNGTSLGNGTSPGKRSEFTAKEVLSLLKAAEERKDHQLADVIRLGMWTGARIESLCALRVENVTADAFDVADKIAAGRRTVPIHSKLKATMRRLVKASEDGYLIPGLAADKYGDRSGPMSKRFGRLKTSLGFDGRHVFHSIRKTVATLLENAGVLEGVAADILGHEKKTMTYGLYSGGASLEVKRKAIEKLRYA